MRAILLGTLTWVLTLCVGFNSFAAEPKLTFGYMYGQQPHNGWYRANVICQLSNGSYITAGQFEGLTIQGLDSSGNEKWVKSLRVSGSESVTGIRPTNDGGFVIVGVAWDWLGERWDEDVWVIKGDSTGNIQWQRSYGGDGWDDGCAIQQTKDGGYIVAATSMSFGLADPWILKLDSAGNIEWQKQYENVRAVWPCYVQQLADGGFGVLGIDGLEGQWAIAFLRLDASGEPLWNKVYQWGQGGSYAGSFLETEQGGFMVAGTAYGYTDYLMNCWLFELDATGNILWEKEYLDYDYQVADSLTRGDDNGYVIGGLYGVSGWLLKVDSVGNPVWQRYFPEEWGPGSTCTISTSDGGYAMVGSQDMHTDWQSSWMLKLDENGGMDSTCTLAVDTQAVAVPTHALVEARVARTVSTPGSMQDPAVPIVSQAFKQTLLCTSGPYVTGSPWKKGNPFRLYLSGMNFQPDAKVFIGDHASPWKYVKVKSPNLIVLKGSGLRAQFQHGHTRIRILNGDGGETYTLWPPE